MEKPAGTRGKLGGKTGKVDRKAVATNNFTTLGSRLHKNKFLIYIKKLLGWQPTNNKIKKGN